MRPTTRIRATYLLMVAALLAACQPRAAQPESAEPAAPVAPVETVTEVVTPAVIVVTPPPAPVPPPAPAPAPTVTETERPDPADDGDCNDPEDVGDPACEPDEPGDPTSDCSRGGFIDEDCDGVSDTEEEIYGEYVDAHPYQEDGNGDGDFNDPEDACFDGYEWLPCD